LSQRRISAAAIDATDTPEPYRMIVRSVAMRSRCGSAHSRQSTASATAISLSAERPRYAHAIAIGPTPARARPSDTPV